MIEPNSELIIDFELVRKNIQEIKKRLPKDCNFMGVIKSDAYGHDLKIATNANTSISRKQSEPDF